MKNPQNKGSLTFGYKSIDKEQALTRFSNLIRLYPYHPTKSSIENIGWLTPEGFFRISDIPKKPFCGIIELLHRKGFPLVDNWLNHIENLRQKKKTTTQTRNNLVNHLSKLLRSIGYEEENARIIVNNQYKELSIWIREMYEKINYLNEKGGWSSEFIQHSIRRKEVGDAYKEYRKTKAKRMKKIIDQYHKRLSELVGAEKVERLIRNSFRYYKSERKLFKNPSEEEILSWKLIRMDYHSDIVKSVYEQQLPLEKIFTETFHFKHNLNETNILTSVEFDILINEIFILMGYNWVSCINGDLISQTGLKVDISEIKQNSEKLKDSENINSITNVFEVLKECYAFIDYRCAYFREDDQWISIVATFRFTNKGYDEINEYHNRLRKLTHNTDWFKIEFEILNIEDWKSKWEETKKGTEFLEESFDLNSIDLKKNLENNANSPITQFDRDYNTIQFNVSSTRFEEHHKKLESLKEKRELRSIGIKSVYPIIKNTLQIGFNKTSQVFSIFLFPIYIKIKNVKYTGNHLIGEIEYYNIFLNSNLIIKHNLRGIEEGIIDKLCLEEKIDLEQDYYTTQFDIIIDKELHQIEENTSQFVISLYFSRLNQELTEFRIYVYDSELAQEEGTYEEEIKKVEILNESQDLFIKPDFKDFQLSEYEELINLINRSAYDDKYYRILPILLRCLFENLLYDIFQTGLDKNHTELFFLKSQSRARDFSQLIALLNILKDRDFKPYHKDSINQNIIDVLKEIQMFGNWTVHQILRQVDKDFADIWEQKLNRALTAILVLYKKLNNKALLITDQDTIDKIQKTLNLGGLKKLGDDYNGNNDKIVLKEEEYLDAYSTEEKQRRPNIELIKMCLEFISDPEISFEDLNDRLSSIIMEIYYFSILRDINKEENEIGLKIIQTICENLLKRDDKNLISRFLEILYRLSRMDIFIQSLKSICLNTFIQLYKEKNYFLYLIELLDNCGYFSNIKEELIHAIDEKDYTLLEKIENLTLSAYKSEGIDLVKALQLKLKEINSLEDLRLRELTKRIIKTIENAVIFEK